MTEIPTVADRLGTALGAVLGMDRPPVRLRAWDGTVAGPEDAPELVVRSPQALRRLVWAPGELGLARAYVAGELDVADDLAAAFAALSSAGRLASDDDSAGPSVVAPKRLGVRDGSASRTA